MSWQEHYGFRTGYSGRAGGTTVLQGDLPGFGPGDLRKAKGEGYTSLSILDWLRSNDFGAQHSEHGTSGSREINQGVYNTLIGQAAMERGLREGYQNRVDTSNLVTQSSLDDTISNLPDYSTQIEDLTSQQSSNSLAIAANQASANAAMTAANQVRTPFAVTGNSAMQIQGAPSSNQLAGQIATGLGGLSRNQRRFQNTTLNI
tara:strand:+ start:1079 stop:1687 length:609 start_codon:yes stop_codon:yes gene_type:complete